MAHISTYKDTEGACSIITLALAPGNLLAHSAIQGINSCPVYPITTPESRETIVDRMPCLGAYAPSGIQTHDSLITSQEHDPLLHSAPTLPLYPYNLIRPAVSWRVWLSVKK